MNDRTPAKPTSAESIAAALENRESNVALRTLSGQGGLLLLIGVFGGVTLDRASSDSGLELMGLLLILAACAAVGLMAVVV